jgi:alpha-L-fucosidase
MSTRRHLSLCAAALAGLVTVAFGPAVRGQDRVARTSEIVATVDRVAAHGPFAPQWKSLEGFEPPAWYVDGKFGVFIHWGLYAVPAFGNEWYPRNMYKKGTPEFDHHVATFGPQRAFGYKDFIPRFTAAKYDPAYWASVFKRAGARFVVPVAEHHDGFPMYDCSFCEYSAARMGPKRDLVGDLAAAVRKEGLVFGLSSHRAEHWWFFDQGMTFDSDVKEPGVAGLYGPARPEKASTPDAAYLDDWLARTAELVDRYRPQLVWFDWWIEQPVFQPYLQRFAAFYYNRGVEWGQGVAINYKNKSFPTGTAVFDVERGQLAGIRPEFWQTDTSVSKNSWGFVERQDYKQSGDIVDDLVDIVSKNGALLLNIGPRPDGTIPEPEEAMLLEIGRWLETNGEAIYGTRPWTVFGEGPTAVVEGSFNDTKRSAFTGQDMRFTTKGNTLYAIALARPGRTLTIKALATGKGPVVARGTTVTLLGHESPLACTQTPDGLVVAVPEHLPEQPAYAFRVSLGR